MPSIKVNNINIFYNEVGSGEPLILIMGLGADNLLWEKHIDKCKEKFRCIAIDNRDAGQSDKPEGPYTTYEMAELTLNRVNTSQDTAQIY
jgi:pimeloyl-ACP methyl ester carboxylesterase